MDSDEVAKLVDGVYKNILEKFNPGARQLITAGKGYLKALHGAASASLLFNESLAKIAMNAQHSGTSDIGAALLSAVSVYKETQEQQMNILKAFYVDLLVPLETNLEKDIKVVQHEQKKFLQQHKVRVESYQKAINTMKKQRKKKSSPENTEKELRSLQSLEDHKKKLDAFCNQSYKTAMTQERRRYGFVLERQCSIAKHWMAYHAIGKAVIANNIDGWQEIATSREIIPPTTYDTNYIKRIEHSKDEGGSGGMSQLKKAHSVDAPYGDMRTLHEDTNYSNNNNNVSKHDNNNRRYSQNSLPRAKSDFNLPSATTQDNWDQRPVVKALYAYMPSGENQLPFEEGDKIALVGNEAKGWQFGENLRTQMFGWFPIAYTNSECAGGDGIDTRNGIFVNNGAVMGGPVDKRNPFEERTSYENVNFQRNSTGQAYNDYMTDNFLNLGARKSDSMYRRRNNNEEESSPTRMFGDTINLRHQKKYRGTSGINPRPGPPPTLPAPTPAAPYTQRLNASQSFCVPNDNHLLERRTQKGQSGSQVVQNRLLSNKKQAALNHAKVTASKPTATKTSLHSSNDSGFANEPPPQPEIDYSDEEPSNRVPIRHHKDNNISRKPRQTISWTLNRNFRNSIDCQIGDNHRQRGAGEKQRYDGMIASDDELLQTSANGIKRTKSFWKFGRNDDILAGMSLWQHRDLVMTSSVNANHKNSLQGRKLSRDQINADSGDQADSLLDPDGKNHTLADSNSSRDKQPNEIITGMHLYDGHAAESDDIYGTNSTFKKFTGHQQQQTQIHTRRYQQQHDHQRQQQQKRMGIHTGYTPKSRMKIMKTIEIDIENPGENERLNSMKRSQKESQKVMSRNESVLQQSNDEKIREHDIANNSNSSTSTNNNNSNKMQHQHEPRNQSSKFASNYNLNNSLSQQNIEDALKINQDQHHQQQHRMLLQQQQIEELQQQQQQMQSSMSNPVELLQSTDDEGDSDNNGTLKMSDINNFFDDLSHDVGSGMILKTVKRKDILKQYYTSEDETDADEIKSTSSDPYDCIVINDHLVPGDENIKKQLKKKDQKNTSYQEEHQIKFQTFRSTTTPQTKTMSNTILPQNGSIPQKHPEDQEVSDEEENYNNERGGTLTRTSQMINSAFSTPPASVLPRTRLMKSSNLTSMTLERKKNKSHGNDMSSEKVHHNSKSYGPWYDFWEPRLQQ